MAAQDLRADRVERAEPGHAFDGAADEARNALAHLACRLVGEGDGEDFEGPRPARGEDVGDARGQNPGLAGAGAGEDEHRPVDSLDRLALFRVEPVEIRRGGREAAGAVGDPAGFGAKPSGSPRAGAGGNGSSSNGWAGSPAAASKQTGFGESQPGTDNERYSQRLRHFPGRAPIKAPARPHSGAVRGGGRCGARPQRPRSG